jgi:hypothetical protein
MHFIALQSIKKVADLMYAPCSVLRGIEEIAVIMANF